jgi:DNA-binding transcriptional regulator YhcF (GntR family)
MSSEKGTSERLLSIDEVARRLGVVTTTVRRHLTQLRASGLQRVEIGAGSRLVRFREDSLDRMIKRAAEREESIIKDSVRQGAKTERLLKT